MQPAGDGPGHISGELGCLGVMSSEPLRHRETSSQTAPGHLDPGSDFSFLFTKPYFLRTCVVHPLHRI